MNTKNRTKKSAILLSVLVVLCCVSLIVGATLALFSGRDTYPINISSGDIAIETQVSLDGVLRQSGTQSEPELILNADGSDSMTIPDGVSEGGTLGTVAIADPAEGAAEGTVKAISLTGLGEGTGARFTLTITNKSNIAMKYIAYIDTGAENEQDFARASLTYWTVENGVRTQAEGGRTVAFTEGEDGNWVYAAPVTDTENGVTAAEITLEIFLPLGAEGGSADNMALVVEAMQSNAFTGNVSYGGAEYETVDEALNALADTAEPGSSHNIYLGEGEFEISGESLQRALEAVGNGTLSITGQGSDTTTISGPMEIVTSGNVEISGVTLGGLSVSGNAAAGASARTMALSARSSDPAVSLNGVAVKVADENAVDVTGVALTMSDSDIVLTDTYGGADNEPVSAIRVSGGSAVFTDVSIDADYSRGGSSPSARRPVVYAANGAQVSFIDCAVDVNTDAATSEYRITPIYVTGDQTRLTLGGDTAVVLEGRETALSGNSNGDGAYVDGNAVFAMEGNASLTAAYGPFLCRGAAFDISGNAKVEAAYFAINGNNTNGTMTINIADNAQISSLFDVAIYMPNVGTINMTGGTIEGNWAGIHAKMGTIDISGGTFEIVNNHIIIAAASAEINISDGIFTSSYSNTGTPEEASAACDGIIYACDNYTSALNITGGTFTTSDGGSVITPGTLGSMSVVLDGGIFNSNLVAGENTATEPNTIAVGNTNLTANAAVIAADKLPANFTATDITLGGAAYKMVGEAEAGVGRIGSEFYTDAEAFDEAIKNIDENDTVINIFEDVTLSGEINIPAETTVTIKDGKTVKLSDGCSLTNNGSINGSVGVQDGAAMINNGNISGAIYIDGGADSEEPGALTNAAAGRIEGRIIITGTGVFENLNTEEGSAPEPEYVVSAIAFTSDSTTVVLGRTRQLEVVFIPENAEAPITWSSSDENVARVDENGVVSGLSLGTATITATCGEGENAMTATCEVTVRQQGGVTGNLGWGEGNNTEYTVYIGNTRNGTVTASQSRAGRGDTVTFRTSPDDGYTVYTVNVYDAYGADVSVLKNSENSYEFTMPGSSVTIRVEFTEDDVWRNPYRDVSESDWFYDAVEYVAQNGLFYGTETYLFSPNDTMTRAMLVTVIYRMEGMPVVSSGSTFSDVVTDEYYADAVKWASANGIVNGIGYNLFAPNDNVTREQIAAIIHRYSQYKGYATSASGNLGRFTDANMISSWALSDLRWAVGTGLMIGHDDGRLGPADNATRAEVATMLMRYCEDIAN